MRIRSIRDTFPRIGQRRSVGGSSVAPRVFLVKAEFGTPEAAPILSPHVADVGTLVVTQVDGQMSIAGGELVVPVQTTPAWGDQGVRSPNTQARAAGLMLATEITFSTIGAGGSFLAAFGTDTGYGGGGTVLANNYDGSGFVINSTALFYWVGLGGVNLALTISTGVAYTFAVVLRATGSYLLVKISGTWRLVYVDSTVTATDLYAKLSNNNSALTAGKFWYRQIANGAFANDTVPTLNLTNPPTGTIYTSGIVADAFHEMEVTAPNPLSGESSLNFKVVDDNNKWKTYLDSTGRFRVDTVAAGVATNRLSVSSAIAAGNQRTIQARASGNLHDFYSVAAGLATKRGGTITNSHQQTQAGVSATFTDYTVQRLSQYPQNSIEYDELDGS